MTAKEYLSRAYLLDQQIRSKLEQVQSLRELAFQCTANTENERVSATPDPTKTQEIIAKIVDLEDEITDDVETLVDVKCEIKRAIDTVEKPLHRLILEQRYLLCKSWDEVADSVCYETNTVYKIHKGILRNFKTVQ